MDESGPCYQQFWSKNLEVLEYIRKNEVDPTTAMESFARWYSDLKGKYNCTFVARPASYDWQWINALYDEFAPINMPPLPFSITCISTINKLLVELGVSHNDIIKPLITHPKFNNTHYADEDALHQAYMYLRMLNWMRKNVIFKDLGQ